MAFIHSWKLLKWVCIKAASHVAALAARRSPCPAPHFPNQVHWKMCFIFGRNFSPTSTPAPISVAFSLFLRFYNKLDLRKNRSPFISGGLMVSRRAAHNKKNTPSRVGRKWVESGSRVGGGSGHPDDSGWSDKCLFMVAHSWLGFCHASAELCQFGHLLYNE